MAGETAGGQRSRRVQHPAPGRIEHQGQAGARLGAAAPELEAGLPRVARLMAPDVRAVWRSPWFDRVGAAAYDFFVERERLARIGGLALWGSDARLLYRSLDAISDAP